MNKVVRDFFNKTKYENMGESDQSRGIKQPPLELWYDEGKKLIDLLDPHNIKTTNANILELIENRRSIRKYKDIPISMEELSYLLWCTQRVKELIPGKATFRTVPSAGARHPFETYLLINNVNGLEPGLYRYIALKHKLIPEKMDEDIADRVTKACLDQRFIKTSAVTFIWAAIPFRAVWRYSERAYRYIHLDAGHVCQNLYLSAEDIDCGVCAIAAYLDDEINNLLGLDGENGFVIYIASLGKV